MDDGVKNIFSMLEQNRIFQEMFDIIRMVDPERGVLLEFGADNQVRETEICCTDVFGSNERCRNCTSTRAFYSDKTMIKLEYAGGAVLLIFSVPIVHDGRRIVVEMVKDISESMTVDVRDQHRVDSMTAVIDNLNRLATTDSLTNLYNRRYLDEHLPPLIESCHRLGMPLCVSLLDIDNFKPVNDEYGHQAGDMVLAATAGSISSFVRRGSDWAARYGGEEFLVCFVGVRLEDGIKIIERVRQHVEENLVLLDDGQGISVTVSAGVTELRFGESARDLIARCDELLYQAKRNGKNRSEYAPVEPVIGRAAPAGRA